MRSSMAVRFFLVFGALLFLFSTVDVIPVANAKTKIKHSKVKKAWVGERIEIDAEIKDDDRVDVARVYFKSETAADYNFVQMRGSSRGAYTAILPAPSAKGKIEYLLLIKNGANEVRRTKPYSIKVKKSRDRGGAVPTDQVNVYTELSEAPSTVSGFSDNITVDLVESGARYGVVAGLYSSASAGTSGGTNATNAGVSSSGATNATYAGLASTGGGGGVAIGVGLAALAVGGAVAAGGSGDDESPPPPPPPPPPAPVDPAPPPDEDLELKSAIFRGSITENCAADFGSGPEDTGSCTWQVTCPVTFRDRPGETIEGTCSDSLESSSGNFPGCSFAISGSCSLSGIVGGDVSFSSGCDRIRSGRVTSDVGILSISPTSNSYDDASDTCESDGAQLRR